jgi:homoserine dehydrogenase
VYSRIARRLRIILVGFGVVNQSLVKLLLSRMDDIYARYGMKPRIVGVADSKGSIVSRSMQGLDLKRLLEVKRVYGSVAKYNHDECKLSSMDEMIEDVDAEVMVEATPTNLKDGEPGLTHIINAIRHKKHVVTVNKGPLALAMPSLIELAEYNNVALRFSGTVGGGTPILEFAKHCLKGDRILSFRGILNGTTNYILSMMEQGLSFSDALDDARAKGYAEADPSLDIDGYDAAAKLVITANWVIGMKSTLKDVRFEGIRKIKQEHILDAKSKGLVIKLIASCSEDRELIVKPMAIDKHDPLCVNGTLNAITFVSEHSGELTLIGKGAGGLETASAILRDLIEIREVISRG